MVRWVPGMGGMWARQELGDGGLGWVEGRGGWGGKGELRAWVGRTHADFGPLTHAQHAGLHPFQGTLCVSHQDQHNTVTAPWLVCLAPTRHCR